MARRGTVSAESNGSEPYRPDDSVILEAVHGEADAAPETVVLATECECAAQLCEKVNSE